MADLDRRVPRPMPRSRSVARRPDRLRRGLVEILAVPALGGVVLATLVLGHHRLVLPWRCLTFVLLATPAVLAQLRYVGRHSDDPWLRGLSMLSVGTCVLTMGGWAAGWLAAAGTGLAWLFFTDDGFAHRIEATVVVGGTIGPALVAFWRWVGHPGAAP